MKIHKYYLSIVSPVFGSPELVGELCNRLHNVLPTITNDYEIVLVFDCSPDDGWEQIEEQCALDPRVRGVRLARNFGQHPAITAGLTVASGDWVVVMDCDLQDQPEEIPRLYAHAQSGFDLVLGQRQRRQDSALKTLGSRMFYRAFSYMTDTQQDPRVANFGIYRRCVIDAILSMGDYVRYFPTMAQWVGFRRDSIAIEHAPRTQGKSNYSVRKLLSLAFDTIIVFSDKPLRLTVQVGMAIWILSSTVSVVYFVRYLLGQITVSGYTSLFLSIWFLGGIIVFLLGVVGLYLGKTFDQAKGRPTYIVAATKNLTETAR